MAEGQMIKEKIDRFDVSRMIDLLNSFPHQIEEAIALGERFNLPNPKKEIRQVVLAGMGGSAIGGNLLQRLMFSASSLPMTVMRYYELPAWVNENSLVILSSFSGNTEETLSAFKQAGLRKAQRLCITSGGQLAQMAAEQDVPVIKIPGGRPPRTALGYLMIPILVLFAKLGWVKLVPDSFNELLTYLHRKVEEFAPDNDHEGNLALRTAQQLCNRLPIIYNSVMLEPVGLRWKGQFSENSKILAFQNNVPEMNHNEIVGWERVGKLGMQSLVQVIYLCDKEDHPRVQTRLEVMKEIFHLNNVQVMEFFSEGESLLARLFSLIILGDYISYYLAILNDVDPTPIRNIDLLKQRLAQRN
ncbi:bifunctional phosphoglucose/phosphomannose isomerase [candidate division KSB1 bacterium]|nr:MAG: bifunctional phosphoglucose/phosphomannose isomerase [candidate division KSB1 bacterium]RKY88297.1 MAG: bifunctional phosphoglucose/phosphomannose isomerase [candidate division KSB1 bacterium]